MTSECGPTGKYCYMAYENVCPRCEECIACGDCQCEDDPVEMTEKMALGIVGLAIIYELVKPGRASKVRSMIEAIGRVLPCDIGKPVDPGRESTEVQD